MSPGSHNLIVIFVIVDRDRVVDNVTDFVDFSVNFLEHLGLSYLGLLLLFFVLSLQLKFFFTLVLFVGFLFVFDNVLDIVPLFFEGVEIESDWK